MRIFYLIMLLMAVPTCAKANSIKNSIQNGSGNFSDLLDFNFLPGNWNLDLGLSTEQTTVPVNDQTSGLTTDAIYEFENKLSLGGGINFSYAKTDLVFGTEPHISFGGEIDLKHLQKDEDPDDYVPYISLDLDLGTNKLVQIGKAISTKRLSLTQNSVGLTANFSFWEWFNLKISSTKYSYDKDVQQYVNQLQSAGVFFPRAGLFSNSIQSLVNYQNELTLTFYYKDFDFKISASSAQEASNGSMDQDANALLGYTFIDTWYLALGGGQSISGGINQGYGLLTLGYDY